jgi:hypothetical protein
MLNFDLSFDVIIVTIRWCNYKWVCILWEVDDKKKYHIVYWISGFKLGYILGVKAHYVPPKNYSHKHINCVFGFFFVHVDITILDYFCSFQSYCISFRLELVYFKRKSNKHLRTWTYEIYLCWNKYSQNKKNYKYISKLKLHVKLRNEFFCGGWYWYKSIKFKTI